MRKNKTKQKKTTTTTKKKNLRGFSSQVQTLEFIIHPMAEADRDYTNA